MEYDSLVSIVGDEMRSKLLRLFSINKETIFPPTKLAHTLQTSLANVMSVLKKMEHDGIIVKKRVPKQKHKERKFKEASGYILNKHFESLPLLQRFIDETLPSGKGGLISKLARVPGMKVIVTTGEFTDATSTGKVDFLLAGNEVDEYIVKKLICAMEKQIGKEFKYALLSINAMVHRMQINDKFIRDIFDAPHIIYLDRIGICS